MTAQTAAQRNQSYRARRKAKLERLAVLEGALERLGSMEAFVTTRAVVPGHDDELIARIDFARKALGDVG